MLRWRSAPTVTPVGGVRQLAKSRPCSRHCRALVISLQ